MDSRWACNGWSRHHDISIARSKELILVSGAARSPRCGSVDLPSSFSIVCGYICRSPPALFVISVFISSCWAAAFRSATPYKQEQRGASLNLFSPVKASLWGFIVFYIPPNRYLSTVFGYLLQQFTQLGTGLSGGSVHTFNKQLESTGLVKGE
ncbi:hypothetical protein BJ166DRAFT_119663 [Pestalotiopsis sp. NC0098]|nr:hypothetical protein BJ166DRAFT_119663 [Pestalotiopsis sp. NC0098]